MLCDLVDLVTRHLMMAFYFIIDLFIATWIVRVESDIRLQSESCKHVPEPEGHPGPQQQPVPAPFD